MKRTVITVVLASLLVATAIYAAKHKNSKLAPEPTQIQPKPQDPPKAPISKVIPKVDIVIALDTSGSMSGLINSARQRLWDIVNEVAEAKPTPRLRVGLLTYGSKGNESNGYVVVQSDLTTDLDTVYGKLFELSTSGGTEYVGRVVHRAVGEMSWDEDPDTLRQIFVAGNESADQDRTVTAKQAVKNAGKKDIFVNAIFCGRDNSSDVYSWKQVATQGRGMYASIDHNNGIVAVTTPYDSKINALSKKLNNTYIGYGALGRRSKANQAIQDSNASSVHSGAAASRAMAKASGVYSASSWDLVDARKKGKLKDIPKAKLPVALRGLNDRELDSHVEKQSEERAKVQAEIKELYKKRKKYAAAEKKKAGKSENKAFDKAVKKAIRTQAAAKNIAF